MCDPCVVDEHIQAAELLLYALGRCGDGRLIRDIKWYRTGIPLDALGCSLSTLEVARADHDREAMSGEIFGDLEADALVGSGDEGDWLFVHNGVSTADSRAALGVSWLISRAKNAQAGTPTTGYNRWMTTSVDIPVAMPGVRAVRWMTTELHAGVKEHYAVGRLERGHTQWWGAGRVWNSSPGSILVKQPGDVHRDLERSSATAFTLITLPANEVERARGNHKALAFPQLDATDARALPFQRLHDAVCAGADRLAIEVALTEAISAFALISSAHPDYSRPVRRAVDYLRERLADPVTLDDLAVFAGLDKFHLCRAFRSQIGMPPHAYLTRLRILRAKALLLEGTRASDVAPLVGLYDQAQLTRHFRRIVGITPARYARAVLSGRETRILEPA